MAADLYASQPAPKYSVPWLVGDTVLGQDGPGFRASRPQRRRQSMGQGHQGLRHLTVPPPNAKLLANGVVVVTVSLGPEPVVVPDLATLDRAQATTALRSTACASGRSTTARA